MMKSMLPVQNNDVLGALRGFLKIVSRDRHGRGPVRSARDRKRRHRPGAGQRPGPAGAAQPAGTGNADQRRPGGQRADRQASTSPHGCAAAPVRAARPGRAGQAATGFVGGRDRDRYGLPRHLRGWRNMRRRRRTAVSTCPATWRLPNPVRSLPRTGLALRNACQMCVQPVPAQAAVTLQLFGADLSAGIPLEIEDELAGKLQISPCWQTQADRQKRWSSRW